MIRARGSKHVGVHGDDRLVRLQKEKPELVPTNTETRALRLECGRCRGSAEHDWDRVDSGDELLELRGRAGQGRDNKRRDQDDSRRRNNASGICECLLGTLWKGARGKVR